MSVQISCAGVLQCDVLIIGGGATALIAALEARKEVDDVVMVCKGKVGRSGNTIVSAAQFAVSDPDSPDSVEQHFQDTLLGGQGINDEALVQLLTSQVGHRVRDLERYGVPFVRVKGELRRQLSPGHSSPRCVSVQAGDYPKATQGLSITLPLLKQVVSKGVRLIERTPVIKLLVEEGQVCGAIALDVEGQQAVVLQAKAVVLACGGGGRIFALTDNTLDISGDSYALALEAGATLRDMEFVQFFPAYMTSPLKTIIPTRLFAQGAVLRNKAGERFMPRYDPDRAEMATRDVMSRAIFLEMQRTGERGVYLDCTQVPPEVIEQRHLALARVLQKRGLDLQKDYLTISPAVHFIMGGLKIDGQCQSTVPGLYAAGEATGGLHGANRISSNALSETIVFGAIAGRQAVSFARETKGSTPPATGMGLVVHPRKGDISLHEVKEALRQIMWEGVSIVRSEGSLQEASLKVRGCRLALERCSVSTFTHIVELLQIRHMCLTAEAMVASALLRTESRGAHYREDYPSSDERWLGSVHVAKAADQLKVDFVAKGENVLWPDCTSTRESRF
ncbi:MAG TPA: FAD-dependent oxidoreductase [Anaerolineae bacterium]|nr:FAD-dependent oxidoreductase [Anaerolineae bacterium]